LAAEVDEDAFADGEVAGEGYFAAAVVEDGAVAQG
jgi:hypothetical protein